MQRAEKVIFNSDTILLFYRDTDREYVETIQDTLKVSIDALRDYFQLKQDLALEVYLAKNRKEYDVLTAEKLGLNVTAPSDSARIAQTQKNMLLFLSPSVYSTDSSFQYEKTEFERLIFHEMVHVAEELLSPNIEKVSRWFSEGLAIYLSGQWKHEKDYMTTLGRILSGNRRIELYQLSEDVKNAYYLEWTIVAYIEQVWGREKVAGIVRNCTNTEQMLEFIETSRSRFEKDWNLYIVKLRNKWLR